MRRAWSVMRPWRKVIASICAMAAVLAVASPAFAQDAVDIPFDDTQNILDNIFVFVAAVLVIFMQAGFALVEAGLTRAKNAANIMMKNLMDFCVGAILFALIGYNIAYSGADFFGLNWWGAWGGWNAQATTDYALMIPVDFLFQVAFAATAATIVSGAMAERTQFRGYMIYTAIITALIYPIVVNWKWGGGWLDQMGFVDFAGSTLVHSVGGWMALAGAIVIGPRLGKYGKDGKPRAIPGHSIPLAVTGAFILLVGWFGFNPGSELAANAAVPQIAVATALAGAGGAVAAMFTTWIIWKKPDVSMAANGLLAGLVSITAGPHTTLPIWAVVVGAIGGILVVFAVILIERAGVDDPVGAVAVHGVCGAWGTIAVGIFATADARFDGGGESGLLDGGGAGLLVDQIVGVLAVAAFVLVCGFIVFGALKAAGWLRVSPEEEMEGLDIREHGAPGYGPDMLVPVTADADIDVTTGSSTPSSQTT